MSGDDLLLQLALRIGGLGFVAVGGGNAVIPALHDEAVRTQHWMNEADFAAAVALAQAAPGPNMLLIPLIGWHRAGLAGAFVALVAFVLPTTVLAVAGARLLARHARTRFAQAFRWALRPVCAGLLVSAACVLLGAAARTWPYRGPAMLPIFVVAALVTAVVAGRSKRNPLVWLALAACAGALA